MRQPHNFLIGAPLRKFVGSNKMVLELVITDEGPKIHDIYSVRENALVNYD